MLLHGCAALLKADSNAGVSHTSVLEVVKAQGSELASICSSSGKKPISMRAHFEQVLLRRRHERLAHKA